ncbi:MAG TPA: CoA transferase, partial [Pontibacter sp.]
ILRNLIATHHKQELLEVLHRLHVPAGAVNSVPEVFQMPQAREMLLAYPGVGAGVRQVAFRLEGQQQVNLTPPPAYKGAE